MTVVVKATASFAGEGARRQATFVRPRPLVPVPPREDDDRPLPDDFAPSRLMCDLTVIGHVDVTPLPSGERPARHLTIRAAGVAASFIVPREGHVGRVPLRPPYLQAAGESEARLGARPTPDPARHDFFFPEGFDFNLYSCANLRLRVAQIATGSVLVLEGFLDHAERLEITLPDLGARALIDWTRDDVRTDVDLFLDTVTIDIDEQVIDLVWRGFVDTTYQPRKQIDRIAVGWCRDQDWDDHEDTGDEERFEDLLPELPRSTFGHAWEREDVLAGKEPPELSPPALEMARLETLGILVPPSPTLSLAQHAAIAAALVEEAEPRSTVLRKAGMDAFSWMLEERAMAERLGTLSRAPGSERIQIEYGRLFKQALDAFAQPGENWLNAREYAEISVRTEVEGSQEVLSEVGLRRGVWMRVDRAWQERMAVDPGVAQEVADHFARERERRGEPRAVQVDELGEFK